MIGALIHVLIVVIVLGLVWWLMTLIPLPAPFAQIAQVIIIIIAVLIIIALLWPLAGGTSHL